MRSALLFLLCVYSLCANAERWTDVEIKQAQSFSTTLFKDVKDPSNWYLKSRSAIDLGERLFSDKRLSSNGEIACSSCHIKQYHFTDNKKLAIGVKKGFRNTPTLLHVAHHDWFFADGAKDSLWSQVLSSLENPAEQNFSRTQLLHLIATDKSYRTQYQALFKETLPAKTQLATLPKEAGPNAQLKHLIAWKKLNKTQRDSINKVFTNVGKALAAFVSNIKVEPTRFDIFLKTLGSQKSTMILNESEQRGFRLFMSKKSGCANCHSGPLFSNKSFHHIATGIPGHDNGRSEVLELVLRDEFNCLSKYSDAKPEQCIDINYINRDRHRLSGTFKTATLRGISKTAPYMHDGRFESLEKVMEHYLTISELPSGHTDLSPMNLSKEEQKDIINFLGSL